MKIIGNTTSPYDRKVRIVLAEKKLDYQYEQENPWLPTTTIGVANPLGKVPCLVLEGGEAIFDSRVIVEYLDTLSPVGKLIPPNGRDRAEVKTWEALADGVLDAALAARLENTFAGRAPEQRCQAWIDRQIDKIHSGLAAMSQGLGEKAYCGNVHMNLADIAVGSALGYLSFRFPTIDWRSAHPNLAKLFDKLSQRQSFIDTAPH
jgi:glutathione S-transferase